MWKPTATVVLRGATIVAFVTLWAQTGGGNVANVKGSVFALHPLAGRPVTSSALLTAATFAVSFDVVPGAAPFQVLVTNTISPEVRAVIDIDPGRNTWQASYTVATASTRVGDFSAAGFPVLDFLTCGESGCRPFPGKVVPLSRLEPSVNPPLQLLPLPNNPNAAGGVNGMYLAAGKLPADGRFQQGATNFGGFSELRFGRGAKTCTFELKVDGLLVATDAVALEIP